jgi:flagellar basal-body rod protein FlgG
MPDGSTKYTRDGALVINANGNLVTSSGFLLEPAITIPTDAATIDIGKDGTVNVTNSTGTSSVAGTIQLARFLNPAGLSSEGDNLLAETEASGTPTTGTPSENGFGSIQSGFLEKSNVQMVTELVNLIQAQRAYEINSRAIKTGDDMLRTANEVVR